MENSTNASGKIFGPKSENFRRALDKQLRESVWTWGKDFQEQVEAREGALEAWRGFAPRDEAEAMLAAQMIGVHNAAMAALHRAALETMTPEERERALNQAYKLMGLFQSQVAALDKHSGKGQQKITVEHVTVEAGGQAIVGNVETPALAPLGSRRVVPPPMDQGASVSGANHVRSRTRRAND